MTSINFNSLGDLRLYTTQRLASLLESHTRTETFARSIGDLIRSMHRTVLTDLTRLVEVDRGQFVNGLQDVLTHCQRLEKTLDILFEQYARHHANGTQALRSLTRETNHTLLGLSSTLIEKDLFERQSQVLQQIILSHERITQWKPFIQEILLDFNAIFPFNFFFIAFAEEHSFSLYVYFLGSYSDEIKAEVRGRLLRQMAEETGFPADAAWDVEEVEIATGKQASDGDFKMLTVKVPDYTPKLAGLLGVAFVSEDQMLPQEQAVINSILSVMVMVIGSSKVLSHTLAELEYYAVHDPLTGLYNRRQFNAMLEYEVGRSERHHHKFAVVLLDLDDFKDINDSYGHPTGDDALRKIADVLAARVRKGDLATRIGGDEFALILSETDRNGAMTAANNICSAVREVEFTSQDGRTFHLTVSAGVVIYPDDSTEMQDILAGVDAAMYRAKAMGKDSACAMDGGVGQINVIRNTRDHAEQLRQALREERIVPFFQPIVNCQTGEVFAYESLARMHQTDGQTISAMQFIDAIEKYSLGRELDRAIVSKGLQTLKAVSETGAQHKLFINLSAQEIEGRGILGYAEETCAALNIPPNRVVFEILERDAIGDMTNMRKFLTNLRSKGFAFALDDFGSGYNSFHYLRELHFDFVKIDGAFVRNILNSKIDRALVQNLANLCRDIGIQTVAEFVESAEILDSLRTMSIDFVQGYHIGHARPSI